MPFQRNRSDVLSGSERVKSARKCLRLIEESQPDLNRWRTNDRTFYRQELEFAKLPTYLPSEPDLQWLRDLVSRYVTN